MNIIYLKWECMDFFVSIVSGRFGWFLFVFDIKFQLISKLVNQFFPIKLFRMAQKAFASHHERVKTTITMIHLIICFLPVIYHVKINIILLILNNIINNISHVQGMRKDCYCTTSTNDECGLRSYFNKIHASSSVSTAP